MTAGEVTGTTPDGQITARRLDRSATVTLPNRYTTEHLQLGYATTQTRVQSLTVDAALCAVTHASRRDQLYVGMTRGRGENHLLVVTDQPQHDEDTPPDHLPPDHIIRTVMSRGGSHPLSVPAGVVHRHPPSSRRPPTQNIGHPPPRSPPRPDQRRHPPHTHPRTDRTDRRRRSRSPNRRSDRSVARRRTRRRRRSRRSRPGVGRRHVRPHRKRRRHRRT